MPSLLARLAFKFTSRHEDLATEALAYILDKSERARGAFINYLNTKFHVQLPNNVRFQAQQRMQDNTIPDLVGFDEHGNSVVIVEAKFWAGLTGNQPNAYLEDLPSNTPGLLVFIAPTARVDDLWPEILSRRGVNPDHAHGANVWQVGVHHLGITTWREVINAIHDALAGAQEREENTIAYVLQLRDLCKRLDPLVTFTPILPGEMGSEIATRIIQCRAIINAVVGQLRRTRVADTRGFKATTADFSWGRSFRLRGNVCDLVFLPEAWAHHRETPLWLVVRNHENKTTEELRQALDQLARVTPPRLITDDNDRKLLIPIIVPTGDGLDNVITNITAQISAVAELLPDHTNEVAQRNAQEPAAPCQPSD